MGVDGLEPSISCCAMHHLGREGEKKLMAVHQISMLRNGTSLAVQRSPYLCFNCGRKAIML